MVCSLAGGVYLPEPSNAGHLHHNTAEVNGCDKIVKLVPLPGQVDLRIAGEPVLKDAKRQLAE